MNLKSLLKALPLAALLPASAHASGGAVKVFNIFEILAEKFLPAHEAAGHVDAGYWWPVLSALGTLLLITVVGLLSGLNRLQPEKMSDEELLPPKSFGLLAFLELCWAVVSSTLESILGEKNFPKFAWLLAGTFFFIIFSNLMGLIPGFAPATETFQMNIGIALVIFLMFNFYGLKYAGFDYVKHMGGPIWWLFPLIFVIEFMGMFARPVSLSMRLTGNVWGDHLVFGIFSGLVDDAGLPWLPVPALLLVFGLLVACLQSFIFMTLSAVYIKLSLDTAHHDHDSH